MVGESETNVVVKHVKVVCDQSFEGARQSFEAFLPTLDNRVFSLLQQGDFEHAGEMLEKGPELSIFQSRDHGSVLKVAGIERKVLQYDVGNPLTASKMTRHKLSAALYAPVRVVLYEDTEGRAVFEYDKPSSTFGQFGDEAVLAVASSLDVLIATAIQQVGH